MYFFPGNPYNIPVDSIFAYIADFLVSAVILRFILIVSKKQDKSEKNTVNLHNGPVLDHLISNDMSTEGSSSDTENINQDFSQNTNADSNH